MPELTLAKLREANAILDAPIKMVEVLSCPKCTMLLFRLTPSGRVPIHKDLSLVAMPRCGGMKPVARSIPESYLRFEGLLRA